MRLVAFLTLLLALVAPYAVRAHSLGVDRATLTEIAPGDYRLVSKVPPAIAPSIRAPDLPERCQPQGSPAGKRGGYSVTFSFSCAPALTARDTVSLPWKRDGALLTVTWLDQPPVTRLASSEGGVIPVALADWQAGSGSAWSAARRYTGLGVEHILSGLDHLLFVLALLFVVGGRWQLLKTITSFTVAHSITLALATLGFVHVPAAPVEATIALSIVFLAAEILTHQPDAPSLTYRRPWLVAFLFGLLHGLGFAGALSEIGLPPSEVPIALLFFNVGVEIGQIAFVLMILAFAWLVGRLSVSSSLRDYGRVMVVYGIGALSMYWTLDRLIGMSTAT